MGAESSRGFPTSKVLLREIVLLDCSTNSNTALIDRTSYISLVTDLTHIYGQANIQLAVYACKLQLFAFRSNN